MLAVDLVPPRLTELVIIRHELIMKANRLFVLLFLAFLWLARTASYFFEVDRFDTPLFSLGCDVWVLGHRFK